MPDFMKVDKERNDVCVQWCIHQTVGIKWYFIVKNGTVNQISDQYYQNNIADNSL